MYGGFNSKIYFVTDDYEIVEPITNYFSEKFFEKEVGGLFSWTLENKFPDALWDWTAEEKFLIVSVDNLQKLEKNFIEQFHHICVYKNDIALTLQEIQKIYDNKKPRAIFYFENKFDLKKFIEYQALFYTSFSGCSEFSIVDFYKTLTTTDARILNVKFCPEADIFKKNFSEPVAIIFCRPDDDDTPSIIEWSEKIPNATFIFGTVDKPEIKNLCGVFYAEEILTDEMTVSKKFFAEVQKILSDGEINLFLKSATELKNYFKNIPAVKIFYENEIIYPGKILRYTSEGGAEINFNINQFLEVKIAAEKNSVVGEVYQNEFEFYIGPKSFEHDSWNYSEDSKIFSFKNFEELKSALKEPSLCAEINCGIIYAEEDSFCAKIRAALKNLVSDSKSFSQNILATKNLIEEILKSL